jgi:transcriptional regulator with XRE-family HTH domain
LIIMLALGKVEQVKRLLAQGVLSQRKIALTVGVSRGIVSAIATGRRPDYAAGKFERATQALPLGPVERCPTCGGMVHMPCRLCGVRLEQAHEEAALKKLRRRAKQQMVNRLLGAVLLQAARERESAALEVETTHHEPYA